MKRTKESWLSNSSFKNNVSGLRAFDGEDLHFEQRKKSMMTVQKKWLDMQIQEKELRRAQSEEEQKLYEIQAGQVNRLRGALYDELEKKKKIMNESTRDFNRKLFLEKQREKEQDKKMKRSQELDDLKKQEDIRKVQPFINPWR